MFKTDLRFHFFQIFLSLSSTASFSCFFLASRHWGAMNKAPRSTTIAAMALVRMYREDIKAKFRRYSFLLLGSIFFESLTVSFYFFREKVFISTLVESARKISWPNEQLWNPSSRGSAFNQAIWAWPNVVLVYYKHKKIK